MLLVGYVTLALFTAAAPKTPAPRAKPQDSVTSSEEESKVSAREAFSRGREAFTRNQFRIAAHWFGVAQHLVPHPNTRYNLALALEADGRFAAAWHEFGQLIVETRNPEDLLDARQRQIELAGRIAVVRVHTTDINNACIDDLPLEKTRSPGWYELMVDPGTHRILLGTTQRSYKLQAAHTYQFEVDTRFAAQDKRSQKRAKSFAIAGIGLASTSIVLGGAALATNDAKQARAQAGLQVASISAAVLALGSAALAWQVQSRLRQPSATQIPTSAMRLYCEPLTDSAAANREKATATSGASAPPKAQTE